MTYLARWFAAAALSLSAGLSVFGTGTAAAEPYPVVVELYTSQGCSSCPPADAFFAKDLVGRSDVIALALHVDYWDYIGWKDDLADPAYTKRQRAYARAAGHRSVYTPQMIIGGKDHVIGTKPRDVTAHLRDHAAKPSPVAMQATLKDGQLTVKLAPEGEALAPMVVHLVRYSPKDTRDVKRGENAGKTLSYANTVTSWETLGEWRGNRAKTFRSKVAGNAPVVVLVQHKNHGPIVAAAELR
ncbi:DUF1223 domain-containing protein [Cognatishimia sp. SS12]|uniref:DUF1223 domain-containing protein n=1 Tax=Cognatishimia sp. SS12 TaxID=2979465 RepID=UPI0023311C2F|nr:DUF1223 domain-containing protein [Cognatishimia sp. SS12]MDC0738521.1 DUF1223 domain-containing protein [Cognatishimia sp. SS12]